MAMAHSYSKANSTDNLLYNRYQINNQNNPQSRTQMRHYSYATNSEHRRATNVRGSKTVWIRISLYIDGIISCMVGVLQDQRISIPGRLLERPSSWLGFAQTYDKYKEEVRRGVRL